MFNILIHQENAKQNYFEIFYLTSLRVERYKGTSGKKQNNKTKRNPPVVDVGKGEH